LTRTLKNLSQKITNSSLKERNETLALFGLPPTTRDAAALYVVYESLEMMNEYNDQHEFLTGLCHSDFSLETLAAYVNETLSFSGMSAIGLDPDAIVCACENGSELVHDRKEIWKMKCFDIGQFHVPSAGLDFRSPLLNYTFYQDICSRAWNITDIGDMNVTNLRFGGRDSRAQSILFTMSQDDPALHLMLEESKNWTEIVKMDDARRSSPGADIRTPREGEDPNLTRMRTRALDQAFAWINETCNQTCANGRCLLHVCRCNVGFTGDNCSEVEIENNRFKAVAIAAVVGPTAAIIVTALLAWRTILTHPDPHAGLSAMQSLDVPNPDDWAARRRRRGPPPQIPPPGQ
jgi:hypothetical protein